MKVKRILQSFLVPFVSLVFITCTTEDISPAASLELSQIVLSEQNESITLTATLNGAATKDIRIPLVFAGTATINADYTISSAEILIVKGATTGSITITSRTDGLVEGPETIEIAIGQAVDVIVLNAATLTVTINDLDVDTDGDGVPDALDQCPTIPGVVANNGCPYVGFIINEVLYDPADGIAGDANKDGTRDPLQDEFIEFYNSTANSINLSGFTISDASQVRHIFPAGTIVPSNKAIVIFGGGTPTGSFGGSIVQTASEGQLNMNNGGDLVTIRNASNTVILTFDINGLSGNPNEAYTRNPDIYGAAFERYSAIPAAGAVIHTPGTKINGNSF
jgi:hypothetical protein